MEEAGLVDKLMLFDLSRQEALIYLCLLKNKDLTGYEVSKITGISRSNVYNSLASLVEKGGAYIVEGASTKYTAVSLAEYCDNHIRSLKAVSAYLVKNSPMREIATEGYITIDGYQHISNKIHHMLLSTEKRVYLLAKSDFLEKWSGDIIELLQSEKKVVIISERLPDVLLDEKWCNKIIFYPMENEEEKPYPDKEKQVRIIIDSEFVITGELAGNENDSCLYSAKKNLVNVFKDAMRNEIELIKIKKEKEV